MKVELKASVIIGGIVFGYGQLSNDGSFTKKS